MKTSNKMTSTSKMAGDKMDNKTTKMSNKEDKGKMDQPKN